MIKINPEEEGTKSLHHYLLSSVGPRPIALASTIDKNGCPNLSPFSYFNIFSSNPPILVFSPARRVRDNTTKDTLENAKEVKEVVINVVTENIVEQMTITSLDYPNTIDEFERASFTHLKSELVKPFRVKESPIQFECEIKDIISLGDNGGAGNLIVCRVLLMHISEAILDKEKKINPKKLNLVGRLGFNWYIKSDSKSLFEIEKKTIPNITIKELPEYIKNNSLFSKNDLVKLASVKSKPTDKEIIDFQKTKNISKILNIGSDKEIKKKLYLKAKKEIEKNSIYDAWKYLLIKN